MQLDDDSNDKSPVRRKPSLSESRRLEADNCAWEQPIMNTLVLEVDGIMAMSSAIMIKVALDQACHLLRVLIKNMKGLSAQGWGIGNNIVLGLCPSTSKGANCHTGRDEPTIACPPPLCW